MTSVAIVERSVSSSKILLPMNEMRATPVVGTFVDREDQVDAVLRALDDLRIDGGGEFAVAAIELDDALHVGLHLGAREDRTRLHLHFLGQVLFGDLVVTFEHDLVDDRVFDDVDGQRRAVPIELHVGEKAGGEQGLQRSVDGLLVIRIADMDRHVGKNSRRLDALRARDHDVLDRAGPAAPALQACWCAAADSALARIRESARPMTAKQPAPRAGAVRKDRQAGSSSRLMIPACGHRNDRGRKFDSK